MDRSSLVSARAENLKYQVIAGLKTKPVEYSGKGHQTLKLMISVGAAFNHMQS